MYKKRKYYGKPLKYRRIGYGDVHLNPYYKKRKAIGPSPYKKVTKKYASNVAKKTKQIHSLEQNVKASATLKYVDWMFGNNFTIPYVVDTPGDAAFVVSPITQQQALNIIDYGNSSYTKVGNRICMKRIDLNYQFIPSTLDPIPARDRPQTARLCLVYCKDTNFAAYPIPGQLFQGVYTNGVRVASGFFSPLNDELLGVCEILYDKRFILGCLNGGVLDNNFGGATDAPSLYIQESIDLAGREIVFNETNATSIADIRKGALILCLTGGAIGNIQWSLAGYSRLWFTEKQK